MTTAVAGAQTDVATERLNRKQGLAAVVRWFRTIGFCEGVAGHVTVRDRELTGHFSFLPIKSLVLAEPPELLD